MDVYLNGKMIPYDQAAVSHDDAGLQHAVGLFETMYAAQGRVFRLRAHLQRLTGSAHELGLCPDLDADQLQRAVEQTVSHNQLNEARVRLTVTPGRVSLLRPPDGKRVDSTVLVVASEPVKFDAAYFEDGVSVLIGPPAANPFDAMAGHKTLAYWPRLRLLRQAAAVQASEVLLLNITHHLASGAVSNVWLVRDGKLLTPFAHGEESAGALAAPVLAGITRTTVLEIADREHLDVERRMLGVDDLLAADEVFLTNSSWHLLPVSHVEKKPVANGKVGPLTDRLRSALLALIAKETGGI